jgi:signal transduction histidine kinase
MLKHRTLALTLYVYAILVFVIMAGIVHVAFEALLRAREPSELLERMAPRVAFLAQEIVRAGPGTAAARTRIRELEAGMAVSLTYFPWSAQDAYPVALHREPLAISRSTRPNPFAQTYWARIEQGNQRVGALRVQFHRQFRRMGNRGQSGFGPLVIVLILALAVIPPLIFWVIRPIRRLEAAAHRLGAGDLETPVRLNRHDELGRLAAAFDTMRERLRHMLHERERLLTDVSHEIRGPLARMAVAQDLLESDVGDNPYVARLRREMQHLDLLTGELLSLSRQRQSQPPQWTNVAVGDLVRSLVHERDLLTAQQEIALVTDLTACEARSDADLLARALGNLLDNALKYTGPGGNVCVRTHEVAVGVSIVIEDDGPGIPAEALPHIFEPFYRPDMARTRSTGGSGMGLAIVRAIIDRLQGTIRLESQEGIGTTVTVTLPRP